MTVIYEVTATVRVDLWEAYERYMIARHIPDLVATGSFERATIARSGDGRYRMLYEAASQEQLGGYLSQHAARLRDDVKAHFPDGVESTREVWNMIEEFRS